MTWHPQTRGGWLRHAGLATPAAIPQPHGAVAMDTGGTKDYAPRGTERARPPRARRSARARGVWRPALVALALAIAVLALLATRARAQPGGSAPPRAVRVGIGGGVAVPVGNFKDGYQSGALRRDLQNGVAGQAFVEFRPGAFPVGFRASVTYNRFGIDKVRVGSTGAEVAGADGTSEILGGLGNVTLQFPGGPIRPYVLAGVGAFNVKNRFTGLTGAAAQSADVSETDFGLNGGAGVTLRLAGLEAFVEARVANVYTKRERFGNLKTVQYVPVTFGLLF
jgi:opacity protein-like surface antigen